MLTLILTTLIYLLSIYLSRKYMLIAYDKKGRWKSLEKDVTDKIITFAPIVNTAFVVVGWVFFKPKN